MFAGSSKHVLSRIHQPRNDWTKLEAECLRGCMGLPNQSFPLRGAEPRGERAINPEGILLGLRQSTVDHFVFTKVV
jgi:hypothetical protein